MQDKKNKIYIPAIIIFWIITALFILILFAMFVPFRVMNFGMFVVPFQVLLFALGILLIVLAAKARFTKISKIFFILTGSAALGMGLSIILHNLLYAFFIKFFSKNLQQSMMTGDEPFFFILATVVCPLILMAGVIGIIVLLAKKKVKA